VNNPMADRLKKGTNQKRGPWKHVGPKLPAKTRETTNKKRTNANDTESAVQREVVLQAKRMGVQLWRQQAGRIFTGRYTIQLAPSGAADLTGMLAQGVRLEVEVKKRFGGTQSKVQKEWQRYIEENNGVYLLVHSGEDFKEQLTKVIRKY